MNIIIKAMETEAEIRGKAYVHWKSWQEAYPGLVSPAYLEKLSLEKCEEIAFRRPENTLVAKDGERVRGFVCYGGGDDPDTGEIFALYVLAAYYGTGLGRRLMDAGLERLRDCPEVRLWVLQGNARAIRFYEKCGFRPDGAEKELPALSAREIRMRLRR
ncbi:MAG: GNAT family N-acetyltransferase [Oscillospiraceae bacterium]|nr:GNAT family N-acetyltransferase [Oscillospiraceae bacterium]